MALPVLRSALLGAEDGLRHGFYTRVGGCSRGVYESLNCGPRSRDAASNVARNRARVATDVGARGDALVTLRQVHGDRVVHADRGVVVDVTRGDGLVCATPRVAIGVLSADCAPVLLADPRAGVIGAAHAGWRGACAGIVGSVVAAMRERGAVPARIRAVVGPAIQWDSYEVGEDLIDGVRQCGARDAERLVRRIGRGVHFDLPGLVKARCLEAGIASFEDLRVDTCRDARRFFSHRRAVRRRESDCGRQLSVIMLA